VGTSFQPPASGGAHESEIRSLSDRAGATEVEVRTLFASEFARLKMGAKVSSYLTVLTTSSVRGTLLRRKAARLAAAADGPSR
jgi:hypothetical protein